MVLSIRLSELEQFVYEETGKQISFSHSGPGKIRVSYDLGLMSVYADFCISSMYDNVLRLNYSGSMGVDTAINALLSYSSIDGVYRPLPNSLKICLDEIPQAKSYLRDYKVENIQFVGNFVEVEFTRK